MQKLANKVAIITGGSSGIGLAAAKLFVAEGATVVVFARSGEGLERALGELGPKAIAVQGDVTNEGDLRRLVHDTKERFGGIDILFANAAVVKLAPLAETTSAFFNEVVGVNLKGTFDTLRYGVSALRPQASVIVTTSWLNRVGFAGSAAVSMTKAALRALVRVAAAELGPQGVRVNALCPGAIETPLWGKLGLPEAALREAGAAITAQIPLGRWGRAEEVARAALFLASSESSYLTGTELAVDGGLRQT
jgi:NAD(P)-dependent dehydrogenase (short-subunit alcohol dehydrogenase family)